MEQTIQEWWDYPLPDMTYEEFVGSKKEVIERSGFDVQRREMSAPLLAEGFEHQPDMVKWALRVGRALIAATFGMGKTICQLEIGKLIHKHVSQVHDETGKAFLVIGPLGVRTQFINEDGPLLELDVDYITSDEDFEKLTAQGKWLFFTNYERVRDGNISAKTISQLGGASLDEGAVLRSLGSKTWDVFIDLFRAVQYRFVFTATPSPNNYIELINYAVWLGKADRGYLLTRYFQRDSTKAGNLTLYPHEEENFWLWVSTWALFIYKPSDLGYDDGDYQLPKLNVFWHRLPVDHRRAWQSVDNRGQRRLLLDANGSLQDAAREKRETIDARLQEAKRIMSEHDPDTHWMIWHHLEAERQAIKQEIPNAVTVYGTQDIDKREQAIIDFSYGRIPILATKPSVAGSGCNFQRYCHDVIFLGIDSKFHDIIQAIHRFYRFQQKHDVNLHFIFVESEDSTVNNFRRKWKQHDKLVKKMQSIVKKYGLKDRALEFAMHRKQGVKRQEVNGMARFTAVNNDCVLEMRQMEENKFDMVLTSIPFSTHYEYVDQLEDFGHNKNDDEFFKQMDYFVPELLRVLKPGRIAAIHVKDLIDYGHKSASGFMEVNFFSAKTWMSFVRHGWMFAGEIVITTDVVRENNSTYRLGWSEMCKDGSKMGTGLPEKVLLFRKPPTDKSTAYADERVLHDKESYTRAQWQIDAHSHWRSNGNSLVAPYDYAAHVKRLEELDDKGNLPASFFIEPPLSNTCWVWDDISPMHTLNSEQSRRRQELHICPLPLDTVKRLIERFTSDPALTDEPELIYDPFAGLFTVPYIAIQMGRRGYGTELNAAYFRAGVEYCKMAEQKALAPTLFDFLVSGWIVYQARL